MNENSQSFLGTGWGFPPTFEKFSHSVRLSSGIEDIKESIIIILETTPGERIMQPEFGCHLKRMVFEKLDATFETEIKNIVRHALLNFEPRVIFNDLTVLQENEREGIIKLQIDFTVIRTNTRHNIVYPFYLQQGTNLGDTKW